MKKSSLTPLILHEKIESDPINSCINSAVFYSGYGNGAKAGQFVAINKGKKTIEKTAGGKWLDGLKLYPNQKGSNSILTDEQADLIWSRASSRYAEGASGSVVAFIEGAK